jgi:hypothetical protein
MALQLGLATPSQVGVDLDPKKEGEMNSIEMKSQFATPKTPISESLPGQPQQGRPKNSKDSQERKEKEFAPQTGASLNLWTINAQEKISEILNPILIDFYNKKNMRSLSSEEYNEAEITKSKIFFSLDPMSEVSRELVLAKLNTMDSIDVKNKYNTYKNFTKNMMVKMNRSLTAEENKFTKSYVYQLVYNN